MKLTVEEKVYGLSLIWKEAEYNFPFWKNLEGLDWDRAYRDALPKVIRAETLREYYLELCRFISLLRDGHTTVWPPREVYVEEGAGLMPVCIGMIGDKWCVANSDISLDIPLYDEIKTINGRPVTEYVEEKIYPYCWHENKPASSWQINYLLPVVEYKKEVSIETESGIFGVKAKDGEINWKNCKKLEPNEKLTEIFASKTHKICLTDDNIAVITIKTFTESELGRELYDNMPKIKFCRGYIIDVRNNEGGNSDNADYVAQAFIEGEFTSSAERKMVHIGTYKAWGQYYDLDKPDKSIERNKKLYDICKRRYFEYTVDKKKIDECPFTLKAPLVVLENENTCSAAEDMLVSFDAAGRATIVGTPSNGSTGEPLFFELPGGGRGRICTCWCTYPDGREFVNTGIMPHVYASLSLKDCREGYDSVLDAGIKVLREKLS